MRIYIYTSQIWGIFLTPYSMATIKKNIYFLTPHFKYIKREKITDGDLMKSNGSSVDPFDYHGSNCGN